MLPGGADVASESESEDDEPADATDASADSADVAGASADAADAAGASADAAEDDNAAESLPSDNAPSTAALAPALAPATPRAPEPPPPWALHIARERRSSGLGAGGYGGVLSSSFRSFPGNKPTHTRARQFSFDSRDEAQKQHPFVAGFSLPDSRA